MKKIIVKTMVLAAVCGTLFYHATYGAVPGPDYRIELFDAAGRTIRVYTTKVVPEDHGGSCTFRDNKNKLVIIAGTFVVEQQ